MATKEKGAEAEIAEEEKEILPELTGMPIEVHFRRHFRFILFILFCLFLGWYAFALMLIAWVTGVRWAERIRTSTANPNFSKISMAGLSVSKSESLPITIATNGISSALAEDKFPVA